MWLALLAYDWFLCLGEESRLVWKGFGKITGSSLVYVLSRYMILIQTFLAVMTNYPMSNLVRALSTMCSMFSTLHLGVQRWNFQFLEVDMIDLTSHGHFPVAVLSCGSKQ